MITINVQIRPELHAKLKAIAKADGRTMRAYTQRLLEAHIAKEYTKLAGGVLIERADLIGLVK